MPMTWPLTFSSPPLELYRTKEEHKGDRAADDREKADVARGSYWKHD